MTKQETPNEKAQASSDETCCAEMWKSGKHSRAGRQLSSVVWAGLFLWAGVVLLAQHTGTLDSLRTQATELGWLIPSGVDGWTVFFLGAGVIVLAEVVMRLLVSEFGKPEFCTWMGLVMFFAFALGSWGLFWPIALLAVGAVILLGAMFPKRSAVNA